MSNRFLTCRGNLPVPPFDIITIFYPPKFETPFYRGHGLFFALQNEVNGVDVLLHMISQEKYIANCRNPLAFHEI